MRKKIIIKKKKKRVFPQKKKITEAFALRPASPHRSRAFEFVEVARRPRGAGSSGKAPGGAFFWFLSLGFVVSVGLGVAIFGFDSWFF